MCFTEAGLQTLVRKKTFSLGDLSCSVFQQETRLDFVKTKDFVVYRKTSNGRS